MSALAKLTSSRRCYYKTARETLAWLLGAFCFIALTLRDLLSLGIKTVTRATLPAQQPKCLKCAFMSLLWTTTFRTVPFSIFNLKITRTILMKINHLSLRLKLILS